MCSEPKLTNISGSVVFVPQALQTCSRQQFVRDRLQIAEITRLPHRRRLEGCGSDIIMRWGANYADYALLAPCKAIKAFCYQMGHEMWFIPFLSKHLKGRLDPPISDEKSSLPFLRWVGSPR